MRSKKAILITVLSVAIIVQVLVNCFFAYHMKSRQPSMRDATQFLYTTEQNEMVLNLSDENIDLLTGYIKSGESIINIKLVYFHADSRYEFYTAKIYNTDTNEYINYVRVDYNEKGAKELTLSETVYVEDPPSADPNATQEKYVEPNTQNGIFAFLNQQSVTLYPVE